MREELGDVLLQVVMHAQIAAEEGLFTMEDVVDEVSRKMVRRHPHVFGQVNADTPDEVLTNWEEIKKEEKQGKEWIVSPLREIPQELPALTRMVKVLKKVDKLYEKGNSYEQDVENLQKAVDELRSCTPQTYSEQIGRIIADALIGLSDISRICKLSPEQLLTDRVEDIIDSCENAQNAEKSHKKAILS
jgi:tetrapyrrole methylase family protein/MazG family protein